MTGPFKIEIQNPEKIHRDFREEDPYQCGYLLGRQTLETPIRSIITHATYHGESFGCSTKIAPDVAVGGQLALPASINQDYPCIEKKKRLYICGKNRDQPEYEIVLLSQDGGTIDISFGRNDSHARAKRIGTLDEFVESLTSYAKIIEYVVNAHYRERPDEVHIFYWKPHKRWLAGLGFGEDEAVEALMEAYQSGTGPKVSFDDIGGQKKAKEELQFIGFALKNPKLYSKWGTHPPRGVLLHGPPGTGKTLLAKALAGEIDAAFYEVKISDIVNKWFGESERMIQGVFDKAARDKRAIIYFDEIDAIGSHRGDGESTDSQINARIVATLLVNMDGMSSKDNIMILGSTNRLQAIDGALLRSGRFDKLVEVPQPDKEGRRQILKIHMKHANKVSGRNLFNKGVYKCVVDPDDISGADIAEIVRRTLEAKVKEEAFSGKEPGPVSEADMEAQVKQYERITTRTTFGFHK